MQWFYVSNKVPFILTRTSVSTEKKLTNLSLHFYENDEIRSFWNTLSKAVVLNFCLPMDPFSSSILSVDPFKPIQQDTILLLSRLAGS